MNRVLPDNSADWITVEAASVLIGRSVRTVHLYAEQGRIETRRAGRRSLFERASVETLAAALTTDAQLLGQAAVVRVADTAHSGGELAALRAEVVELRRFLADFATAMADSQVLIERIADEQLYGRCGQTDEALWAALTDVTAERDALRHALVRQYLPWRIAGATLIIVAALLFLALMLTALGIVGTA